MVKTQDDAIMGKRLMSRGNKLEALTLVPGSQDVRHALIPAAARLVTLEKV